MAKRDEFEDQVRQALNHLYEPRFLRSSPLVRLFSLEDRDDPAEGLRLSLEQAIEAFRPATDGEAFSRDRRYYRVLSGRYVQRLTQHAIASHLGITPRHLRREQAAALDRLAEFLRLQYDLRDQTEQTLSVAREIDIAAKPSVEINREMLWLADSLHDQTSEVEPVLREALDLVQALAQQRTVDLCLTAMDALPPAAVPGTVLKQIVLNLLTATIRTLPHGGKLSVAARADMEHVVLTVSAAVERAQCWDQPEIIKAAEVSRRLAELFAGALTLSAIEDILVVKVTLPCVDQRITVLAVEDNVDTLRMWRRYLQNTRFSLSEENDGDRALDTAIRLRPGLIVLDIMLTGRDGWGTLRRLRAHPATASIPIIVCTVLPQSDLALSLGASGFIQKPATGREFRAALEGQIAAAARPQ